jgi:hypothetical protein
MQYVVFVFAIVMLWALWQSNPRDPRTGRGMIALRRQVRLSYRLWLLLMIAFGLTAISASLDLLLR